MRRILLFALLVLVSCGTRGDPFGSQRNGPDMRVTGWKKVDLDPERELSQPFIAVAGPDEEMLEPDLIRFGDRYLCFYESLRLTPSGVPWGSAVFLLESADAVHWAPANDGAPVLTAQAGWEAGFVGAPSVVESGGRLVMYYAAGNGAGIGMAESDDGVTWSRTVDQPLIEPDQEWEEGVVGAPSALALDGEIRLWYSAGAGGDTLASSRAGHAVGHARSPDEVTFTKLDAAGASSDHGDAVEPVLRGTADWEGCATRPSACSVSSPSVVVRETSERRILQMFYTGAEAGEIGGADASIGLAASEDGLDWDKAGTEVNPVVQEVFPLRLSGTEEDLTFDESAPSVLHRPGHSFMVFEQLDALNFLAYGIKGLALATNPPLE